MVFRIAGYSIPRDSSLQASCGKQVESFDLAKAGDLIIFANESNQIDHVGILLEDNKIIHASGKVRIDKLLEEGIIHVEKKLITHNLYSIRRIIP